MSADDRARAWAKQCCDHLLGNAPSTLLHASAPPRALTPRHSVAIEVFADGAPIIAWLPEDRTPHDPQQPTVRAHALPFRAEDAPAETIWIVATVNGHDAVFAFMPTCSAHLPDPGARTIEVLLPIPPPKDGGEELIHRLSLPTRALIHEPARPDTLWDAVLTATSQSLQLQYLGSSRTHFGAHIRLALDRGPLDAAMTAQIHDAGDDQPDSRHPAFRLLVDPDDPLLWAVALTPRKK